MNCPYCKHSLIDNEHGIDQSDFSGDVYLGHCMYCKQCVRPTQRAADALPVDFEDEEFDALPDSDIDGK